MATRSKAVPENVPGSFFVDDTCIDCDTCRQVAPLTFHSAGDYSAVHTQPTDATTALMAARAAVCCPTASIGCDEPDLLKLAATGWPQQLIDGVWYCGWTSRHSYGASSYLVRIEDRLWMIDSPRWSPAVASGITELGGLAGILLTHRDDVADAARYAKHFAAPRLIHHADADAMPDAECVLHEDDFATAVPGAAVIGLPGHTAGSIGLFHNGSLFCGDHLWWSPFRRALHASKGVCWSDWDSQIISMRSLLNLPISHIFPGHGRRYSASVTVMRQELEALIERMQRDDPDAWP